MLKSFFSVISGIFSMLKYPAIFLLVFLAIFGGCILFWFIIYTTKGYRLKKGSHVRQKKESILKRLFIRLPERIITDMFEKDPDFFKYQGCIIFEGRQGSGKTVSMVEFVRRMQKEYPKAKCITNLAYTGEDDQLKDWRMLLNYKNGINGVIVAMDELQNWFSSNDSKNFPPDMLAVITQNRKNRRIILRHKPKFLSTG